MYPKKFNGDEYYPQGKRFLLDPGGKEIYARDRKGGQLYPNRDSDLFARDISGKPYYAKDVHGNEYYPIRRNKSQFITDVNGIKLALYADGTQRYPRDGEGNEYYLKDNMKPMLFRRNTGEYYLAKSKNGHSLIPWNFMSEYINDEPCIYHKDSDGNTVYVKESAFPEAFKVLIRCICRISVICPKITGCNTRFL